jgi:hypothetical protein
MPQFVMLLHESTTGMAGLSPEEIQNIVERYQTWSAKVGKAGKLVGGQKLADEGGRHMSLTSGKVSVRDGPYAEAKEIIGGYVIIEAADYDEAVRISEDCPHLALGGRIELRRVDVMQ